MLPLCLTHSSVISSPDTPGGANSNNWQMKMAKSALRINCHRGLTYTLGFLLFYLPDLSPGHQGTLMGCRWQRAHLPRVSLAPHPYGT